MYCKCGAKIPEVRVKAGYKTCVKCSTEEKWGCSHVVYHKTGNTIEVIKDKELCEQINAMAQRPAFGVCRGMKGNVKKKCARSVKPRVKKDPEMVPTFSFIGATAMDLYERENIEASHKYIDECVKKRWLSQYRANRIIRIIKEFDENTLSKI